LEDNDILKKKTFKLICGLLLISLLIASPSVKVLAASGSTSITTNRAVTFTFTVRGSYSLTAHLSVYAYDLGGGTGAIIQVKKPNGVSCLSGANEWLITSTQPMQFNFANAPAGTYTVTVVPTYGQSVTMAFEILPGYY
jgi:hypothetical protein